MTAIVEQMPNGRSALLPRIARELRFPRQLIHGLDVKALYGFPAVLDLVRFVESASPKSLLTSGETNPEKEDWRRWGEEISTLFFNADNKLAQYQFVAGATNLLSPYQQVGLVGKFWEYGLKGSGRREAVEKLMHAFWHEDGKLAWNEQLLQAVSEFHLCLPQDLVVRLPDKIRELITISEEPEDIEYLD